MDRLIPVNDFRDIPAEYRDTPIGHLLEYHNLEAPFRSYAKAELLVGMCMDNRKSLRTPDSFAFILRTGGANLRYSEFKISYAIAVGGVRHVALIGHTNCGMVDLASRKELFVDQLVDAAGWKRRDAEEQFAEFAPKFEIGDEIGFTASEAVRLRKRYPRITVAPLLYRVEDGRLYFIGE